MSQHETEHLWRGELTPGDEERRDSGPSAGIRGYIMGLGIAAALTVASFSVVGSKLIWPPGIPVALAVLAVAQMGVHLVFFLHITTSPDNTNNILALAFGVVIVAIVVGGSLWIMLHLNSNMMPAVNQLDLHMQH